MARRASRDERAETPRAGLGGTGGLAMQLAAELAVAMRKRRVSIGGGGDGEALLPGGRGDDEGDDAEDWRLSGGRGIQATDM